MRSGTAVIPVFMRVSKHKKYRLDENHWWADYLCTAFIVRNMGEGGEMVGMCQTFFPPNCKSIITIRLTREAIIELLFIQN